MSTPSKPWSPEDLITLKACLEQENGRAVAAKKLGRAPGSIDHGVRLLRTTPEVVNPPAIDWTLKNRPKPPAFGRMELDVVDAGDWITYGLVADTHLCCEEERLAELHTTYDLFAKEGIKHVFHAGNPVDGYVPRINGGSVFKTSIDGQCQYFIDNYPQREGITTNFITGDDHEGWWQKEGFNFGAYLMWMAKDQGRNDLNYIGHVESDVVIAHPDTGKEAIMKIQHPGGGSAYSRSYTGQKQIEAYEGGEKPQILVQGHYHVSNYMQDRNVHVVSMPGFQDQTIFARKKRLRMEVGGCIISFKQNPDGSIYRFRPEFNRFFNRSFYRKFLRSDSKVMKGRLVLK